MKKWASALLVLVLAGLAICLFLSRTWMWADVPRVTLGELSSGAVVKRFSLPAQLQAQDGVDVILDAHLDYALTVEERCAALGDRVEAGQVLLRCAPGAALTEELTAAEQALERARLSALEARPGTEALFAAYADWEAAADAALRAPADEALARREAESLSALEALCAGGDARAALSSRLAAERRLEEAEATCAALRDLTEGAREILAPCDGYVVYLAGAAGEEIAANAPAATLSPEPQLLACAAATAEEAAYFATAQSLSDVSVRVGRVRVSASEPFADTRGAQALLCAPVQLPGAAAGTACTLEMELQSGDGLLLPREAAAVLDESAGKVYFYTLETHQGFFGAEDIARLQEAEALDFDETHILLTGADVSLSEPIVAASSAPLFDGAQVLVVDELR